MANANLAWQTQVLLALMFVGGGYLLWLNKFPPFNEGGAFEQLTKFLPTAETPGGAAGTTDEGDTGDAAATSPPAAGDAAAGGPLPGYGLVPPVGGAVNPLTGGPYPPPGGGGTGAMTPYQQELIGASPQTPFVTDRQTDPSVGDINAYQNYAAALRQQYGATNQPNLGIGSAPMVAGDPNLGTTPVPQSIFNPRQSIYPGMPGMPGYGGMGPYPPQQPGYGGGGGPSVPPNMPFLPSPLQWPGPMQPGPYPNVPPYMPTPPLVPVIPTPPAVIIPGVRLRLQDMPRPHNKSDVYNIDLGYFHEALTGIKFKDMVNAGIDEDYLLPSNISISNPQRMYREIQNFVDSLFYGYNPIIYGGTIVDLVRTGRIRDYWRNRRSNFARSYFGGNETEAIRHMQRPRNRMAFIKKKVRKTVIYNPKVGNVR